MKIRLAFIIPTMDRGGAERQVCLLAAELPKEKFDVHVILLTREGPRTEELDAAGVPHQLIGKSFRFDPTAYFRLRKYLKQLSPDIVHTYLFAANSYGRAAAHAVGVPVIVGSERCVDPWKTWRHHVIDRYLAKFTKAITTNSNGVVDFYRQHGIAQELFRVIPNGISPRKAGCGTRGEMAASFELDPQRKWILAIGRLWPQKRYRDLIWAAEMLNTLRGDDVTLVIAGDGPQRGELLRHRDAVSNDRRIRFVGERDDIADLLPHVQAYWLGSAYEGQSNGLMEAMQSGALCVVSDIPGNRDLIEHDKTGLIVELGDAADFARQTEYAWQHPELAAAMGLASAEKIANDFQISQMVDRHVALYESLLAEAKGEKVGRHAAGNDHTGV
jgi:glycosyltransferase involved in cell wall biosynthesis